ncbi:hypothetical protein RTBOTA2_001172 [Rhodotorula toruloides]|nr:hypothetical protein RTBOTA2_001172 [Rhodotorula toruloides]
MTAWRRAKLREVPTSLDPVSPSPSVLSTACNIGSACAVASSSSMCNFQHVGCGKDYTLFTLVTGYATFYQGAIIGTMDLVFGEVDR